MAFPTSYLRANAQISLAPSQYWDGNDGPWSSFAVQVGTPPQVVRVLMSSSGSSLWVPLPEGCIGTDSKSCPEQRGGLFNYNGSSTWKANGLYELPLQAQSSLGYSGNSLVGFDNITLGWQGSGGPSLNKTLVTGVATKDFFLGHLGLTSRPVNISDFNDQYPSPLSSLFEADEIPSLTWSYTAGAPYRQNKAYGSLTLGGYDAARSDHSNNLTCKMGVDTSRDLLVAITHVSSDGMSLLHSGIYAFIDSTVPHIWLPPDACAAFEAVFGLEYDNTTGLYLVNDTLHETLVRSNANITISLAASLSTDAESSASAIDIILPYGAFDMVAGYPLTSSTDINTTSRYFPLRRASNSSQYTLGRTFLQEAYLHVDYDRSTFTISQTHFPSDPADPGKIVAVYPDASEKRNPGDPNQQHGSSPSNQKLGGAKIAGITIGVILCAASLTAAAVLHRRFRHRHIAALASQRDYRGEQVSARYSSEEHKAELEGDSTVSSNRPFRSRMFLDGRAILQSERCEGPGMSLRATRPALELVMDGRTPVAELGVDRAMLRSELDAVNREIREMPTEIAKELPL